MVNTLTSQVVRVFRRFGLDVRFYRPDTAPAAQLMQILNQHGINLVLDVGANAGHFGRYLRDAGYRERIVSFEPLSTAWDTLSRESRRDPLWEVAPRMALGSRDEEAEINVSGNSVSSSILHMHPTHRDAAPESRFIGKEKVAVRRLDAVIAAYLRSDSVPFLKIDTQGYEDRVLEGAADIMARIAGIQLEVSFVPLYEGQRLFGHMVDWMNGRGFEMWALSPVLIDPQNGRMLQADATFFRSGCPAAPDQKAAC
jgi:FkbM family methyltransferase